MKRCVKPHTELYDKRREQCYEGIPIAQYTHVSSNVGYNVGNSILMGQLHRYRELIQDRDNFAYECGLLLARMHLNGYPLSGLRRKLLSFLRLHPDMFGLQDCGVCRTAVFVGLFVGLRCLHDSLTCVI